MIGDGLGNDGAEVRENTNDDEWKQSCTRMVKVPMLNQRDLTTSSSLPYPTQIRESFEVRGAAAG
jgi:hypothetical protein